MILRKSKLDEILGAQMMENKHQGLDFTKYMLPSMSPPSISKATSKTIFATYTERVKTSGSNVVTKGKTNMPQKKVITPTKVRVSTSKRSTIGYNYSSKIFIYKFGPTRHYCCKLGQIRALFMTLKI